MLPPVLAHTVIVIVTLVWLCNFLAPLLVPSYVADPQLNLVFMTIVGGALALRRDKHDKHRRRER